MKINLEKEDNKKTHYYYEVGIIIDSRDRKKDHKTLKKTGRPQI